MKEVVRKKILEIFDTTIGILETREEKDIEELKTLSEEAIEDVALYKDLDLVSVTVLIYSLYKIVKCVPEQDYEDILTEIKFAKKELASGNLGTYNKNIRSLFNRIKKCNAKVKVHLQDVMEAAKIKESSFLLHKGLSIGQAAGLMGLSNWDLQQYAGKTISLEQNRERLSAKKRMIVALKLFGV